MPRPSLERFIRRHSGIDFRYVSPGHTTKPSVSANERTERGGNFTRRNSIHLGTEVRSPQTQPGYRARYQEEADGDYGPRYAGARDGHGDGYTGDYRYSSSRPTSQNHNRGTTFCVPPQAPSPPRPAAFGSSSGFVGTGESFRESGKTADRRPAPLPRRAASIPVAPRDRDHNARVRSDSTHGLPTRQRKNVATENAEGGERTRRSSDAQKRSVPPTHRSRHPQGSNSGNGNAWRSVAPFEDLEGRLAQQFFDVVDLVQTAQDVVAPFPSLTMSTMRYVIARLLDDRDIVGMLDQPRHRRDDARDLLEVHDAVIDILAADALFRSRYQDKASLEAVPQPMPRHFLNVGAYTYNRVVHWRKLTFMESMTQEGFENYPDMCRHNAKFGLGTNDPSQVLRDYHALTEIWRLINWGAVTKAHFQDAFLALAIDVRETLLNETSSGPTDVISSGRRLIRFDDGHLFFEASYQTARAHRSTHRDPMVDGIRRGLNALAAFSRMARDHLNENVGLSQEADGKPYIISLRGLPAEIRHLRDPMRYQTHLFMYQDWAQAEVTELAENIRHRQR
jgi:hypothetical protein